MFIMQILFINLQRDVLQEESHAETHARRLDSAGL